MDFELPSELRQLRDSTRRFVAEALMPLEARYANEPDIPDDVRRGLQAVSYTHLTLPTTPYV